MSYVSAGYLLVPLAILGAHLTFFSFHQFLSHQLIKKISNFVEQISVFIIAGVSLPLTIIIGTTGLLLFSFATIWDDIEYCKNF